MKGLLRLICLFSICLSAYAENTVYHRSFWTPMYYKLPLNYCLMDGQTCGLPVANAYCQWMGYDKADHIVTAYNLGLTRYYTTKLRCKNWRCNGFKTIRCQGHIQQKPLQRYHYRKTRFAFPRFNGNRVAWCADGMGHGCGKTAAYSFCRRLGYMRTFGFMREDQVGATEAISNQRYCFGRGCAGFKWIDCYR